MKICAECQRHGMIRDKVIERRKRFICMHEAAYKSKDCITGEQYYRTCEEMRAQHAECGPDGALYEPIVPEKYQE